MEEIDGVGITKYQTRFTGLIDEDGSIGTDEMAVCIVIARKAETQITPLADGEVRKKVVLKAEDFRILTGDLRDQALAFVEVGPDQISLRIAPQYPEIEGPVREILDDIAEAEDNVEVEVAALDEGRLTGEELEQLLDGKESPLTNTAVAKSVNKFDPHVVEVDEAVSIYPNGRKDEALRKFMNE